MTTEDQIPTERLEQIRARATCPSAVQAVRIGEYEACARDLIEHDVPYLLALLAERDGTIARVTEVVSRHPDPCVEVSAPISCGWKHAVVDIRWALSGQEGR